MSSKKQAAKTTTTTPKAMPAPTPTPLAAEDAAIEAEVIAEAVAAIKAGSAELAAAKPEPAPSKQQVAVMTLSVEFAKKGVTITPEMISQDGKYLMINIGEGWPAIQIGASGGIVVPVLKSYPTGLIGALEGRERWAKQQEREAKAAQAAQPKAPVTAPAVKQEEVSA